MFRAASRDDETANADLIAGEDVQAGRKSYRLRGGRSSSRGRSRCGGGSAGSRRWLREAGDKVSPLVLIGNDHLLARRGVHIAQAGRRDGVRIFRNSWQISELVSSIHVGCRRDGGIVRLGEGNSYSFYRAAIIRERDLSIYREALVLADQIGRAHV